MPELVIIVAVTWAIAAVTWAIAAVGCGVLGYFVGNLRGQAMMGGVLGFLLGPLGVLIAALLPEAYEEPRYGRSVGHILAKRREEDQTEDWLNRL